MKSQVLISSLLALGLCAPIAANAQFDEREKKNEDVSSLVFNCNVSFHASGKSVYLGVGYTELNGHGTLACFDLLTGAQQDIPLKVKVRGPGAGLGFTGYNVSGGAIGIGLKKEPESLLGKYLSVRGNAAVGVGVGVGTGIRVAKDAFVLTLSVEGQSGLGAGVDLLSVELIEDKTRQRVITKAIVENREEVAPAAQVVTSPQVVVVQPAAPAQPVQVRIGQSVTVVDENGRVLKTFTFAAPKTVTQ
jgi:hypothetical protein